MPTYEYECTKCGYTFERFQNINDKHLTKCPKCSKKVKRLIGMGAGIIFKGTGFYATDYRKKTPPQRMADSPRNMAKKNDATESTCPKAKEGCNACQQP